MTLGHEKTACGQGSFRVSVWSSPVGTYRCGKRLEGALFVFSRAKSCCFGFKNYHLRQKACILGPIW